MSDKRFESTLNIPASAIVFASGLSLIGSAVAGPVGAASFAIFGAVAGVIAELVSQKKHDQTKQDQKDLFPA